MLNINDNYYLSIITNMLLIKWLYSFVFVKSILMQQRQTKSLEELELHYEDEKNSMIAITETDDVIYDDFYDEVDNRIKTDNSMDIIFFGPPSSFLRLDPETILHVLTNIKKTFIPISRALLAWDLITDGKTAAFLQGREFLAFERLLNVIPEEDLYYVNFGDPSVFNYFSKRYVPLENRKFGILAAAYRRYYGNDWYESGSQINELGYLICGFPSHDLKRIAPKTFKELTFDVLSKLDRCSVKQTKALYNIATHPDAYGEPYKWSSHEVGRLNILFNCIPKEQISSIQLEAITAISPKVIKHMNQKKLEFFTKQQILRMNPKTRRIYILRIQLKNSLDTMNQYELSSRLLSLMENNPSYTLTQINGQRIFKKALQAWHGPEPSRNCEVFIGRIPHDCFEDTLVPLFWQAGQLFEFRLMINFSGWNRGYAFAMYATVAEASNAIRLFNNYMIRPSWQLGVCPSINNCRIFISRIPPTMPSDEIVRLLYALTDEVEEVRIRRSPACCAAIVEYRSHRGAAMARKTLAAAAAAVWGSGARPAVDWSLPQSPQLLRQYREIGRWSLERGVELMRADDGPGVSNAGASSYSLERGSQARRLRMIREAQRNAALQHNAQHVRSASVAHASADDWSRQLYGMPSISSLNLGLDSDVWGAPEPPAPHAASSSSRDFNPWTTKYPLEEFMMPKNKDDQEDQDVSVWRAWSRSACRATTRRGWRCCCRSCRASGRY
ncbi:uncharacterized protein [Maniola hyperantus]|uniref:uncharacterized protein n=1 Tax=Aphantopus hyperantus TaxID=2795564 RepID=UPI003748BCDB